MNKTFAEAQTADRRLTLLLGLQGAAQYRGNALLLRRWCDAFGHAVSLARIDTDLAWLAEQGLIKVSTHEGVTVATLTQHGLDVAAGRAEVPGVQVPSPTGS